MTRQITTLFVREETTHLVGKLVADCDASYELVGPKINGNPEGLTERQLLQHGTHLVECPREFDAIRDWLAGQDIEGVVWHHPDGRMAKIKKKDFGLPRKPSTVRV